MQPTVHYMDITFSFFISKETKEQTLLKHLKMLCAMSTCIQWSIEIHQWLHGDGVNVMNMVVTDAQTPYMCYSLGNPGHTNNIVLAQPQPSGSLPICPISIKTLTWQHKWHMVCRSSSHLHSNNPSLEHTLIWHSPFKHVLPPPQSVPLGLASCAGHSTDLPVCQNVKDNNG